MIRFVMLEEESGMDNTVTSNNEIAGELERIADLLKVKGNGHLAYRAAAERVMRAGIDIPGLVESGMDHRISYFPGIGERFRGLIAEFVKTGRTELRSRLEREAAGMRRTG